MLYHFVLYPLSLLPLGVLQFISKLLYIVLRFVVGYRKEVVRNNIARAFPHWSNAQRRDLEKQSYRHLADLMAEGIKNLSISREELLNRMNLENPELFNKLYAEGKHVILLSSHLCNWEFFITAQSFLLPHRAFGIGKRIQKGNLNEQINKRRERFGMTVINAANYREVLDSEVRGEPLAVLTLADQSPSRKNAFWVEFFGVQTAFAFGAEYMAHAYGMAVVYLSMKKVRPGYYQVHPKLICSDGREQSYGEITRQYVTWLEEDIKAAPETWLWSHRRWKHVPPDNLSQEKSEHKQRFLKKFKGDKE